MTASTTAPVVDALLLGDLRRAVAADRGAVLGRVEAVLADRWAALEALLPGTVGDALTSRIVHADAHFSIVALTLPPATETFVHDHLTWCVVAVVRGTEHESTYLDRGDHLDEVARSTNLTGSVTSLTPPGDIHRVRNVSTVPAVSIHVYGTDLSRAGSSVRRTYDLPIRALTHPC